MDSLQTLIVSLTPALLAGGLSALSFVCAKHSDGEERARGCRKMLLRELRMRLATGIAKELEAMERENPTVADDHDAYVGRIAQKMNDYLYGHDKTVIDFVATHVRYDQYVRSVSFLTVGAVVLLISSIILAILPFVLPGNWSSRILLGWLVLPTILTLVLVVAAEIRRTRFNQLVDRYEVVLSEKL